MVDTCDLFVASFKLVSHIEALEQSFCTNLYAVAETNSLNSCVTEHISCEHCHGVCIVEEPCVGANLFHIASESLKHVDCSQCTEDTTDTQCVTDCLTEAVFLRNLEVNDGAGVIKSYLDGINYEIRAAKSIFSLFNAEVFLDCRSAFVNGIVHF